MNETMSAFHREASELSRQLRLGHSIEAALALEPFLSRWVSTLTQAQLGSKVAALRAMLDCQARSDWLGLADYLQYDLFMDLDLDHR